MPNKLKARLTKQSGSDQKNHIANQKQ